MIKREGDEAFERPWKRASRIAPSRSSTRDSGLRGTSLSRASCTSTDFRATARTAPSSNGHRPRHDSRAQRNGPEERRRTGSFHAKSWSAQAARHLGIAVGSGHLGCLNQDHSYEVVDPQRHASSLGLTRHSFGSTLAAPMQHRATETLWTASAILLPRTIGMGRRALWLSGTLGRSLASVSHRFRIVLR